MKIMNNKKFKRIFVIVTDSLGVGELTDSYKYDDVGANTFKHLSYSKNDFYIPTLDKMGIGNKLNAAETSGEITSSLQNRWWPIMYQYLEKVSVFIDQFLR